MSNGAPVEELVERYRAAVYAQDVSTSGCKPQAEGTPC